MTALTTPAQLSLAWMVCKKPYIVPIPGSRKVGRLQENARAADIELTMEGVYTSLTVLPKRLSGMIGLFHPNSPHKGCSFDLKNAILMLLKPGGNNKWNN